MQREPRENQEMDAMRNRRKDDEPMDTNRIGRGFGWGVAATVVMSAFMLLATATGISPLPQPIPAAIARGLLGEGSPAPLIVGFAIVAHLGYGGVWGAVLAALVRPVTLGRGVMLGLGLWLLMQILVLPLLGWGLFGSAISMRVAAGTLVLHLIYGATLGLTMDRASATETA